jgi:hypothetical protein
LVANEQSHRFLKVIIPCGALSDRHDKDSGITGKLKF